MAYSEDDIFLGVLPFFHIYGQVIVLLGGLVDGAKTVTMPKFDPEMFLNLIQKHRVCNFIEDFHQIYLCHTIICYRNFTYTCLCDFYFYHQPSIAKGYLL